MISSQKKRVESYLTRQDELDRDCWADRVCNWVRWLHSGQCIIRDVHQRLVPLIPNDAQLMVIERMLEQAFNGRPIRLRILKARKRGISTLVHSFFYFLCAHYEQQNAFMLANHHKSTRQIFRIARTMAQKHICAAAFNEPDVGPLTITFPQTESVHTCHTAGGAGSTVGSTPNLLHISEGSLWAPAIKEETHMEAVNAVPMVKTSAIIEEFTYDGRELFYENWSAAYQGDGVYDALFIPWFINRDLYLDAPMGFAVNDQEEKLAGMALREYDIEIAPGALYWRRLKINELGDRRFRIQFPATTDDLVEFLEDLVLPGMRSCVIEPIPMNHRPADAVGGIDYGFHDATVVVTGYYVDQVLCVREVYRRIQGLAADHVHALRDDHHYYIDPSELGPRHELLKEARKHNRRVTIDKAPRLGIRTADEDEWDLLRRLIAERRLTITRTASAQLLYEAENLLYNRKTGKPDMRRDPQQIDGADGESFGHFDALCALRYCAAGATRPRGPLAPERAPTRGLKQEMLGW